MILNKKINNHLIIIFGGAGKLGEFIQNKLSKDKENSFLILDKYEKKLFPNSKNMIYAKCDANDSLELKRILEANTKDNQKITVLNLIGFDFPVSKNSKPFFTPLSVSDQDLLKTIELNLLTSHKITSSLLNLKRTFHLILVSSIYSNKPTKASLYKKINGSQVYKPYIYGASKAALEKLAKDLSTFLPEFKSRVNVVALGGIDFDLPKEFVEKYSKWSPQNCMVNPNSVFELLNWLIFNSPYELNGCVLTLDSGLSNT